MTTPKTEAPDSVTIPREPTREMWAAMASAVVGKTAVHHDVVVSAVYQALLASAPARCDVQTGDQRALEDMTLASNARKAAIEECARVAETQSQLFLSPGYAAEQPMGSFCERFACEEVAKAIRALAVSSANRGTATTAGGTVAIREAALAIALPSTHRERQS